MARMVRLPPSSILRAAPKKRFGGLQCISIEAAGQHAGGRFLVAHSRCREELNGSG